MVLKQSSARRHLKPPTVPCHLVRCASPVPGAQTFVERWIAKFNDRPAKSNAAAEYPVAVALIFIPFTASVEDSECPFCSKILQNCR
jgi:hypothetical protein